MTVATTLQTRRIDVGHITLNVAIAGEGPPVVLLHGLGWDHHLWDRHIASLSTSYQVIAPDTRGHGLSDVPAGPYSARQYADDLVALLDTLGLDKVTLIGFSQGGMTALTMATQHADRLRALGVLCAVARSHPDGQANMEKRIAAMEAEGPEAAARIAGESIFSSAYIAKHRDYFEAFVAHRVRANAEGLVAAMRAGKGFDVMAALPAIDMPTLLIAGEFDKLAPAQAVKAVAEMIPGSEFHLIAESGHMVQIEAPAVFDAILSGFLAAVAELSMSAGASAALAIAVSPSFLRVRRVALPLAFLLTVGALWEWMVGHFHISPATLAAPSAIFDVYAGHAELLLTHLVPTARDALVGFALAAIAGIGLGTLVSFSSGLRQALYPHIVAFQLVPKIAVAPLFVLWFGIDAPGRVLFIVFMAFFPMVVSTMTGLISTPPAMLKLCRALRATEWQSFVHVRFPYAVPHIFAGLKVGATMAILGTVVAEFVTAQKGLGFLIMFGSSAGESAVVMAAVGLLCLVGVVMFGAVALGEMWMRKRLGAGA